MAKFNVGLGKSPDSDTALKPMRIFAEGSSWLAKRGAFGFLSDPSTRRREHTPMYSLTSGMNEAGKYYEFGRQTLLFGLRTPALNRIDRIWWRVLLFPTKL